MISDNNIMVSIIIPCRNEEKFISKCLDSIITQDYPKDKLEILVVDGMSNDDTRKIVKKYIEQYPFIKMLDNPKKIVPTAMNIGIKEAKGDIIVRMDAHTEYPKDYVSKIIYWLDKSGADNVGGICITKSGSNNLLAKAIAFTLSSPFGVGNAMFRIGVKKPKEVDTVPFGAYRKEVFNKIGYFNEKLVRNQDIEFNLRLKKAGGKILLVPDIISHYIARSNIKDFLNNNFLNGLWNVYTIKIAKMKLSLRHYIPFLFVSSIILLAIMSIFFYLFKWFLSSIFIIYFICAFIESFRISFKRGFKYLPVLPIIFFGLHFSYGLGSLWGIFTIWKIKNGT